MTKRQKREAQRLVRSHDWAEGRAADFATAKPKVLAKFTATVAFLAQVIADLGGRAAIQAAGSYGEETSGQRVLRADVEDTLRAFNRSAASIADEKKDPSIMERFRMPVGGSDENLRVRLRAFANAIDELALADDFAALDHEDTAEDLRTMADDFEGTEGEQGGALAEQVGATRMIPILLRDGRTAVKTFNAMFSNRYQGNVELLAAWKSASHLVRDGGPDEDTPEPPAPPPTPPA